MPYDVLADYMSPRLAAVLGAFAELGDHPTMAKAAGIAGRLGVTPDTLMADADRALRIMRGQVRWWDLDVDDLYTEAVSASAGIVTEMPEFAGTSVGRAFGVPRDLGAWCRSVGGQDHTPDNEGVVSGFDQTVLRDARIVEAGGRWPHARHRRQSPVPGDAIAFRLAYLRAALSSEVFVRTSAPPPDTSVGDPSSWWAESSTHSTLWSTCAGALARSVPYWFPASMTQMVAASSELSDTDMADVRLGFRSVFCVFAEPLRIDPTDGAGDDARASGALAAGMRDVVREAAGGVALAGVGFGGQQVPLADLVEGLGAWVEGVVFLSREDGTLCDEVVWCVAVDSAPADLKDAADADSEFGELVTADWSLLSRRVAARVCVPGLIGAGRWHAPLRNMAAFCAWGDWVRPVAVPELGDLSERSQRKLLRKGSYRRAEPSGAVGNVHVIDVAAINDRHRSDEVTGRSVAPHLRRGHWRRVRVVRRDAAGAPVGRRDGVQNVDWVYERRWIAPTVVNPTGPITDAAVYRLG